MKQKKIILNRHPTGLSPWLKVCLCLIAYALFLSLGLGEVALFDWDEINFAEIAREMQVTGDYLQPRINYVPFHEKPPLFAWMQLSAFKLVGTGPFGARLPNVICGALTLLSLWHLGGRASAYKLAYWWMAFMGLSLLPQLYFRSGIIDPWFNLFILLGLWPVFRNAVPAWGNIFWAGGWLGLAVLTKGPAAGLIAGLCCLVLLIMDRDDRGKRSLRYLSFGLLSLLPSLIWIGLLWQEDGGQLVMDFLDYQWRLFSREDAGHGGFPGYHVVVLLIGCFPASIFAIPGLTNRFNPSDDKTIHKLDRGMRILFWVVLILFSIVNTKIVHYSSLAYFPIAWFAARWVTHTSSSIDAPTWLSRTGTTILCLFALASLLLPIIGWQSSALASTSQDPELISRLAMNVPWPWYTILPFLLIIGQLVAVLRLKKRSLPNLAAIYLAGMVLFTAAGLWSFTGRIQTYSQGALTEFFQGLRTSDVYVGTAYHKSYAHWFYSEVQPEVYEYGQTDRHWRFHGPIDKPLFFSSPLRKTDQVLREVPDAVLLYQKGGFSFYQRPAHP
ncbi:glycosyltransferase family 39 protein [Lewinella sp. W8]|uniref:ArnT family glycosyltransferase n=1 Tax=Lewinella sp. W8 TaxID=2528208 RepID=UPI0010688F5F|nr:glycosyltransferase family 39 protein [Lewinella sp. W8]MTB49724.1 glycosyl transferase [Lewinella sp. W8]